MLRMRFHLQATDKDYDLNQLRADSRQPFSITCTRVNLMGSSKNVNDTAPKNYASNYEIDEERNIIDNDDYDASCTSETGCHERRRAYYTAHFLHINKDDLDKKHERPYNRENTASRSICEVMHVLSGLDSSAVGDHARSPDAVLF